MPLNCAFQNGYDSKFYGMYNLLQYEMEDYLRRKCVRKIYFP